jgi:hypothetical protein
LLFLEVIYMSMENHSGMKSTEKHFWFVHQSCLAIVPVVIW